MFSVIIASRDRAQLLDGAIAASLDQIHPPGEVIVVDDGSTDGTDEVIARWSDQGVVGFRTPGVGVTAARNAGLAEATEDWVVFLDDDDRPERGWLEQFRRNATSGCGLISAPIRFVWPDGRTVEAVPEVESATGLQVSLLAGAFAVRRELLVDVGGYLDGLTYAEHSELAMRLLPEVKSRGLRVAVSTDVALTASRTDERRSADGRSNALLKVIDHHRATFDQDPERFARWMSIAGVDAYRNGDHVQARALLWKAFRTRPTPRRAARALVSVARSLTAGSRRNGNVPS